MNTQDTNTPLGVKAFNLGRALSGAPIVRRDGILAKFVGHCPEHPYEGCRVVTFSKGVYWYTFADGRNYSFREAPGDLFMA